MREGTKVPREREREKERDRGKNKAHRPRLVSRKARPISPARFSRAAARTSDGAALGWFCIFCLRFELERVGGKKKVEPT